MGDPELVVYDFDPGSEAMMEVPVRFSGGGNRGRSIVIKRTIEQKPILFARWIIAHGLAHVYLRHKGRWPGEDPEHAADSLAGV